MRPPELEGTTISEILCGCVMASMEPCDVWRLRLSALLWRIVLSCRTALALFKPPVLFDDPNGSGTSGALAAVVVSITRPGERPRPARLGWPDWPRSASVSTQSAGVGGTGPSDVTPLGGGRLVGGEIIGTLDRSML